MAFELNDLFNLIDSAKEKGAEFVGMARERGMGIAGLAMEKTKDAARVAKLTMQMASEKEALRKAYVELGKAYYEEYRSSADGLFAQLCEEVDAVNARIEAAQAELDEAKANLSANPEEADFEEVVSQDEDPDIEVEITEDLDEEIAEEIAEEVPVETSEE